MDRCTVDIWASNDARRILIISLILTYVVAFGSVVLVAIFVVFGELLMGHIKGCLCNVTITWENKGPQKSVVATVGEWLFGLCHAMLQVIMSYLPHLKYKG